MANAAAIETLKSSIPANELAIFKDWMVKQVVITKTASGGSSIAKPGIHVQESGPRAHMSRMGTSKIHKFKPSVSIAQAFAWLVEYGAVDSSIMFENNCSLLFERGRYFEFEDIRDEDDEDGGHEANNPAAASANPASSAADDLPDAPEPAVTVASEHFRPNREGS